MQIVAQAPSTAAGSRFYHAHPRHQRIWNEQIKFATGRADAHLRMLLTPAPKTNVERQREFRMRNPGYFRKYYAVKRSMAKRIRARMQAEAQAAQAALIVAARAEATIAILSKPEPLMLPAPVKDPAMAAIDALAAALASPAIREAIPVPDHQARPAGAR
jgi:hypothetical protein